MSRLFYVDNCDHPRRDWRQATAHLCGVAVDDDIVVLRHSDPNKDPFYLLWPCERDTDVEDAAVVTLKRSRRYANAMEHFAAAVELVERLPQRMRLALYLEPNDVGFRARFGTFTFSWPRVSIRWDEDGASVHLHCLGDRDNADSSVYSYLALQFDSCYNALADCEIAAWLEKGMRAKLARSTCEALFVCDKRNWDVEAVCEIVDLRRDVTVCRGRWSINAKAGQHVYVVRIGDHAVEFGSLTRYRLDAVEAKFGVAAAVVGDPDFEFVEFDDDADELFEYRMTETAYLRPFYRYETLFVLALSWPDFAPYCLLEIADWLPGMTVCPHRKKIALLQGVQRSVRDLRGGRDTDQIASDRINR